LKVLEKFYTFFKALENGFGACKFWNFASEVLESVLIPEWSITDLVLANFGILHQRSLKVF